MSEVAIRVEGLAKQYPLGGPRERYTTLRDGISKRAAAALRALSGATERSRRKPSFWALDDVSFEVPRGEVVGIIGRNGAGKSTLLKILSRITEPTRGEVDIHGRVGSLLEVGTGFHPELTGRENVYLNGAILGMKRSDIARKFDEIVAFAEVEKFVETPVKHYSSGMYMRLAFAVAAHLEPEILIVDEVLAVGDAEFQKKCLGKMGDEAKGGRTVLFVSHNMGAMRGLCKRAIWLEQGRLKRQGESRSLIDEYLADAAISNQPIVNFAGRKNGGDESHKLIIHTLEWLTEVPPRHGEPVAFRIHYESKTDLSEVAFGLGFSGIDGTRLLTLDSDGSGIRPSLVSGQRGCVEFHVDELPVAPGLYSLDLGARSGDRCALVYFGGFAQTEILAGPSTPDTYVCFPGSGVRKASLCRWTLDTVTSGTH